MNDDEDDFSDLTSVEDDDDDDVYEGPGSSTNKTKKTATKGGKNSNAKTGSATGKSGYKIKNVLNTPRATTYTAQALYNKMCYEEINLNPEYQRDVVWPESKQIGIIDSVFRNFYIPPVIFAVERDPEDPASEKMTCIDGKQRLTSIYRFMQGLIPHKDPMSSEKFWFTEMSSQTKGRKRTLLSDKYKKLFENKQIVCVEYHGITDDDEREIFQRVQLGMALTPAEKLQVIKSLRSDFIREIQDAYFLEGAALSSQYLDWDRSRGSDFRCLATVAFCVDKFQSCKNFSTLQQVETYLNLSTPFPPPFCDKLHSTYTVFARLIQDEKYQNTFVDPEKIAPVEFIAISILIAEHKDKLSLSQLSWAIREMRRELREQHKDVRLNTRVAKTALTYIKQLTLAKAGGEKGQAAALAAPVKARNKRKRGDEDDEDDDDDEEEEDVPVVKVKKPARMAAAAIKAAIKTELKATPPAKSKVATKMAELHAARESARLKTSSLPLKPSSTLPPKPTAVATLPPPPSLSSLKPTVQSPLHLHHPQQPPPPPSSSVSASSSSHPKIESENPLEVSLMATFNNMNAQNRIMHSASPVTPHSTIPTNGHAKSYGDLSSYDRDREHGRYGSSAGTILGPNLSRDRDRDRGPERSSTAGPGGGGWRDGRDRDRIPERSNTGGSGGGWRDNRDRDYRDRAEYGRDGRRYSTADPRR